MLVICRQLHTHDLWDVNDIHLNARGLFSHLQYMSQGKFLYNLQNHTKVRIVGALFAEKSALSALCASLYTV